ncbi:hypothetical protein CDAR_566281 [Caerostris darwini]|uniref:Uncharacterized protein n=1 Tax=Caerostris darwini TaxID=1538125 RepID=A0AAV4UDL6_9ARAC|nr:hypothetical protein CDAR_566281 [Caerostris darwini]
MTILNSLTASLGLCNCGANSVHAASERIAECRDRTIPDIMKEFRIKHGNVHCGVLIHVKGFRHDSFLFLDSWRDGKLFFVSVIFEIKLKLLTVILAVLDVSFKLL